MANVDGGAGGCLRPTTCLDLLQINVRHTSSQLIEMGLIRHFYLFQYQLFLNSNSYNQSEKFNFNNENEQQCMLFSNEDMMI